MDYRDLKQAIDSYASQDIEQRKTWYSPAAAAYQKVRPRYPQALIQQAVEVAQLSPDAKILEVGCGPATATVDLAAMGFEMVCLEPNPDFYGLAQQTCSPYPNVAILNASFEEWPLEVGQFDAVLAASSFHWIPAEVGYSKATQALREGGHLILLWNKELQPSYEVYQQMEALYRVHAPALGDRYEDRETQENVLRGLGQIVEDSGQFKQLMAGLVASEVTYSADDYLALLSTYSPYLKLDAHSREALFDRLRHTIERDFGGYLQLSYLSAFHVAQRR